MSKSKVIHVDQIKAFEGDPPRESWVGNDKPEPEVERDIPERDGRQPEEAATFITSDSDQEDIQTDNISHFNGNDDDHDMIDVL